jgi:hypothetical protein
MSMQIWQQTTHRFKSGDTILSVDMGLSEQISSLYFASIPLKLHWLQVKSYVQNWGQGNADCEILVNR